MEPTSEQIKKAGGTGKGQRFLHVGVSEDFLHLVNVEAAEASQTVKDFVIASILKNSRRSNGASKGRTK